MWPTDQTTTSATTARPRITLWAAELKRARIDFVMLSPSLARPGKTRLAASGGQAAFQDQRCFAHDLERIRGFAYVERLARVAGLLEAYTPCGSEHCAGGARECTRHDSVVDLVASAIAAERAGLLPQPEMSILALGWIRECQLRTRPSAEHECRTSTPMSLG